MIEYLGWFPAFLLEDRGAHLFSTTRRKRYVVGFHFHVISREEKWYHLLKIANWEKVSFTHPFKTLLIPNIRFHVDELRLSFWIQLFHIKPIEEFHLILLNFHLFKMCFRWNSFLLCSSALTSEKQLLCPYQQMVHTREKVSKEWKLLLICAFQKVMLLSNFTLVMLTKCPLAVTGFLNLVLYKINIISSL